MDLLPLVGQILLIIIAPLVVGLSMGLDRKITARMHNRVGPPVTQAFYDVVKLLGKRPLLLNNAQAIYAGAALLFQAAALALFVAGGDLLIVFFVSGAGSIAFVLGAFSARSPYSYYGSQRELLTILAYEPVLFLVVLSIGIWEHTFLVRDISGEIILALPLAFASLVAVLVIKLEKSPYDIATAHQEIVSGPYIEYSGPYLALLEIARWFELAFIYGLFTLFVWVGNPLMDVVAKVVTAFVALFIAVLVDNITARLTRERMVKFMLTVGVGLIAVNLLILFIYQKGVL